MSGTAVELHWFPKHDDKFIAWGSEINLYQVKNLSEIDEGNEISTTTYTSISNKTKAILLASETRNQYIRCVAPAHHQNTTELMLAVGLANGKVVLCNFASSEQNVEFSPKQSRPCICLAWHEQDAHLLAIGHDRNRSDHCITVWDTARGIPKEKSILNLIGLSETAHSLCWDKQSKILIAGMSHKYIKIMDLRQSIPTVNVANTRAVHGACMAPNGTYLASYYDNVIHLWDTRNIEKPISTYQAEKNVNDLSWCPTKTSTLATLQRDSPYIHLLDLHFSATDTDIGPHLVKRLVAPFYHKQVASIGTTRTITLSNISWHPTDTERLLALSGSGCICDFHIQQRVAICWDPNNNLTGSDGINVRCLNGITMPGTPSDGGSWDGSISQSILDDIAELMKQRAVNNYGHVIDVNKNGELSQIPSLKSVWKTIGNLMNVDVGVRGVQGLLANDYVETNGNRVDKDQWTCSDYPSITPVRIYKSVRRAKVRQLCGWTFDMVEMGSFEEFMTNLCGRQEYTRAALIAVFHLKLKYAVELLGQATGKSDNVTYLRLAAIALSGFTSEETAIWREQCREALTEISDGHLRAMFRFLLDGTFELLLSESDISMNDRVAFASHILSDIDLIEFVRGQIKISIDQADLNGLLLTGASTCGLSLLQSYIDRTDDVQTAAIISSLYLTKGLIAERAVQFWIQSYRELLDIWALWEYRAQFDITLNQKISYLHPRSVFLLCSFCSKSVSPYIQDDSRMRSTSSNVNRLSSCPSCRKPLPRCSLCLMHMGTSIEITGHHDSSGWQSKSFAKWFSWCQTCRHGGHTAHLFQWFDQYTECPVSSCQCPCFSLDLPLRKEAGT